MQQHEEALPHPLRETLWSGALGSDCRTGRDDCVRFKGNSKRPSKYQKGAQPAQQEDFCGLNKSQPSSGTCERAFPFPMAISQHIKAHAGLQVLSITNTCSAVKSPANTPALLASPRFPPPSHPFAFFITSLPFYLLSLYLLQFSSLSQ